ncbi:hypothetical protein [Duganella sp. Root198D2]|uniref:hypothetical protein n=1 Tax=Duganella sp. Root198D2 TaxID=1736489 RepID=UPI0012E33054|nr:hypothetical protein [Duganella sp. Root198D2]
MQKPFKNRKSPDFRRGFFSVLADSSGIMCTERAENMNAWAAKTVARSQKTGGATASASENWRRSIVWLAGGRAFPSSSNAFNGRQALSKVMAKIKQV